MMKFIHKHLEWIVFSGGLILLGLMNPENSGHSFCLFELAGFDFCPGDGLGHSIAYTFRGEFSQALDAHFAGPVAILILGLRVGQIWQRNYKQYKYQKEEQHG